MSARSRILLAGAVAGVMAMGGLYEAMPTAGMRKYDSYRLTEKDKYLARPDDRKSLGGGAVMVTSLGTTTLLFDDGKTQFLIDGFLTRPHVISAALVRTKPERVDEILRTAGVDAKRLEAVFVSHSHYDHAMDVAYIASHYPSAVLYGSASTHNIGAGAKPPLPEDRNISAHAGEHFEVGDLATDHFTVTLLHSKHSSKPLLFPGTIDEPLAQPAWNWKYKEGGSFDFMVEHGEMARYRKLRILIRAGSNVVMPPADDGQPVDVLFLGVGRLPKDLYQPFFQNTVQRLHPPLVIPIHWDDFFADLSADLKFPMRFVDDSPAAIDSLIRQIGVLNQESGAAEPIKLRLLQGYESIVLRPQIRQ
jgi:L-ascorbate metabolism protein UlaG (beta-lactamase superfamily)